jgi:hypothetical protein
MSERSVSGKSVAFRTSTSVLVGRSRGRPEDASESECSLSDLHSGNAHRTKTALHPGGTVNTGRGGSIPFPHSPGLSSFFDMGQAPPLWYILWTTRKSDAEMRISTSIMIAMIFSAINAPILAQQPKSGDQIQFDPSAARNAAMRKKFFEEKLLVPTRACLHNRVFSYLNSGERSQQKLVELSATECERGLGPTLRQYSDYSPEQIHAILLKMADEELASILAQGR